MLIKSGIPSTGQKLPLFNYGTPFPLTHKAQPPMLRCLKSAFLSSHLIYLNLNMEVSGGYASILCSLTNPAEGGLKNEEEQKRLA